MLDIKAGRAYLVRLLARREYSQFELRKKMREKTYTDAVIEAALAWVIEHDLQSDQRFTECFLRYRKNSGYGPRWIKSALKEKGIASTTISAILAPDQDCWQGVLEQLWLKKFAHTDDLDSAKSKAKQIRFLVARGFCYAQVSSLVLRNKICDKL